MLSDRAVTWIALAVTALWVALNIADAFLTTYEMPTAIHGIMGLVAGGAFGEKVVRKHIGKTDKELGLDDE